MCLDTISSATTNIEHTTWVSIEPFAGGNAHLYAEVSSVYIVSQEEIASVCWVASDLE